MTSDGWDDPKFLAYVRGLQAQARRVRGRTPADSPLRSASARLSQFLASERDRGVPVTRMAQALGVTPAAINLRLGRHGYDKVYPSQAHVAPFGTPHPERPLQEKCYQGHPIDGLSSDGLRRYCRACDNRRHAERRTRLQRKARES